MTQRRPGAAGLPSLHGAAVALCLAIVAACGSATSSAPAPSTTEPTGSPVGSPSAGSPTPTDEPASSESPIASSSLAPSESPAATPPASVHPAAECSGNDENRDFFADIAASVEWTVYCPVLPAGWVVDSGNYRLANGGKLEISYRNRSGSRLELHEGAFCDDGSGCAPAGSHTGQANFGDRAGTLIAGDAGVWAVSVDAGETFGWLAVGRGLDESTFRDAAAALIRVGG